MISDMNPDDIVETIPGFHHTRNRFNRLMEVAAQDPPVSYTHLDVYKRQ